MKTYKVTCSDGRVHTLDEDGRGYISCPGCGYMYGYQKRKVCTNCEECNVCHEQNNCDIPAFVNGIQYRDKILNNGLGC